MKILVIPRRKLGDVILTTPMLRALRAGLPGARLDVVVNGYNRAALEGNSYIDRLHLLRGRKFTSVVGLPGAVMGDLSTLTRLRAERYDAVILGGLGPRSGTLRLARAIRPRKIICALRRRPPRSSVEIDAIPAGPLEERHAVEVNLALLSPLGLDVSDPPPPQVAVDPIASSRARELCRAVGPEPIAVHLSVENPRKRWPHHRFLEFLRAMPSDSDQGFVLLHHDCDGSADLPSLAAKLRRSNPGLRVVARQSTNFAELVAILSLSRAVVCHDSAVAHVGAALGKPILGLYVDENVRCWRPWGVPSVVIAGRESAERIETSDVVDGYRELMPLVRVFRHGAHAISPPHLQRAHQG